MAKLCSRIEQPGFCAGNSGWSRPFHDERSVVEAISRSGERFAAKRILKVLTKVVC